MVPYDFATIYDVGSTLDRALARVKDENALIGALVNPGFLSRLGSSVRNEVRRAILKQSIPDDADVSFQSTFLDNFLADDVPAIDRMSNVHDWKPLLPVRLFHGRDDRTVPYKSSTVALATMLKNGAPASQVSLTDCAATPADHLPCVPLYFSLTMAHVASLARGL